MIPRILFLTCFVQMISMVGFAIWPIYLIELQIQWNLSNSEAGWISGSFYIAPYCYLKSHRTFLSADTVFQVFDEPHVIDIDTPSDYELACSIASLPSMREYVYPFVNGEN